jgi:hypothetical protein
MLTFEKPLLPILTDFVGASRRVPSSKLVDVDRIRTLVPGSPLTRSLRPSLIRTLCLASPANLIEVFFAAGLAEIEAASLPPGSA